MRLFNVIRELNILFALVLFVFICGCSFSPKIPTAQIQSPDRFRSSGHIGIGLSDSKQYVPTTDRDGNPLVFDSEVLNSMVMNTSLDIVLKKKFIFGLGLTSDIGFNIISEYQLFDLTENDVGFVSSIYSNVNLTDRSRPANPSDKIPKEYNKWSGGVQSVNAGLSFGYRFNPNLTTYIGIAHNQTWINTKIEQFVNSNVGNSGGIYSEYFDVYSRSIGFGLEYHLLDVYLKPQIDFVNFQTKSGIEQNFVLSSISLGFLD